MNVKVVTGIGGTTGEIVHVATEEGARTLKEALLVGAFLGIHGMESIVQVNNDLNILYAQNTCQDCLV